MSKATSLIGLLAALLVLSACRGTEPTGSIGSGPAPVEAPPSAADPSSAAGSGTTLFGDLDTARYVDSATRAVVTGAGVDVFDSPGGHHITTLGPTTAFGTTRVLLVEENRGDWLKVLLPIRPNHRSGWIPASAVDLQPIDLSVRVDLAARTMSVRSGGEVLLSSPIAVGTAETPTPIGTFFITDKLATPDPGGAYGPNALGLSGFGVLTEFAGGNGQVGIHGTNDPSSIGQAISHGCVRVPNDVIEELAELLPLGTPVHVF